MSDEFMTKGNGWHRPPSCRKFHYFENGRSLCGGYGFMGVQGTVNTAGKYTDSDCKACIKKLEKEEKKKNG